jgi:hypothetical protein
LAGHKRRNELRLRFDARFCAFRIKEARARLAGVLNRTDWFRRDGRKETWDRIVEIVRELDELETRALLTAIEFEATLNRRLSPPEEG